MSKDFRIWWAQNHPADWWASERDGSPLPHADRLQVRLICEQAFNDSRASVAAVGRDDGSADWCDDCHGYTHKYDCPSKRQEVKTPLVDKIVNAVYRSMAQYEDGTWFLDNLKAKARVNKLLAAAASSAPAEPPISEGE